MQLMNEAASIKKKQESVTLIESTTSEKPILPPTLDILELKNCINWGLLNLLENINKQSYLDSLNYKKLRTLEFYYSFIHGFCHVKNIEEVRLDTDSLYFVLAEEDVNEYILPKWM